MKTIFSKKLRVMPLVLFLLLVPIIQVSAQSTDICGFNYKKVITVQGTQITGGPHTNFAILIDHTDGTNLTTAAGKVESTDGYDIVFADNNGNLLDFQLERYDGTIGNIVAWVKIPTLTNGTNVTIHMLYGKASITTNQSTTNTWDTDYISVYHLNNNNFTDATVNTNTLTNSGSTNNNNAKIGGGRTFGATNTTNVQVPTDTWNPSSGTISFWANQSSFSSNHQYYFGHTTLPAFGNRIQLFTDDAGGNLDLGLGNSHFLHTNITALTAGAWHHISLSWDGSNYNVYVDGTNMASGTYTGLTTIRSISDIGNNGNTAGVKTQSLVGSMDEFSISNTVRSANWISTQHASQNNPEGTFYTISTEVDNDYSSTGNGDWDNITIWNNPVAPHIGANVTINKDVDIDGASSDYIICSCTISSTGAENVRLDMSSTRNLHILQDMNIDFTGDGTSTERIFLNTNSSITLDGDLTVNRSATNTSGDLTLFFQNDARFDIMGDANFTLSGGDDITIDIENNSSVNIAGNLSHTITGGDDIKTYIDQDGQLNVTGNVSLNQTGGDDFRIHLNEADGDNAQYNVTGDMDLNKTGGDDILFTFNGANTLLEVNNLTIDQDASDDDDATFNINDGNFTVNGTSLITRRGSSHEIYFNLNGGNFTSGNFTFRNRGNSGDDHDLWMYADNGSIITINGNMLIDQNGGDDYEIEIDNNSSTTNNSQLIITGNLSIDQDGGDNGRLTLNGNSSMASIGGNLDINMLNTTDSDILINLDEGSINVTGTTTFTRGGSSHEIHLDMDGGTFTTSGITLNNQGTVDVDHSIWINVDEAAIFTVNGDANINETGGNNVQMYANNNAGTNGVIDINGDLNIDHDAGSNIFLRSLGTNSLFDISGALLVDHDGGSMVEIRTAGTNAAFNVGTTAMVQWDGGTDSEFEIDIDAGNVTINGLFTASRSSDTGPIDFNLDGGNFRANSGVNLSSAGTLFNNGAITIDVDEDAIFTCVGNMTNTMSGGDDFRISTNRNSGTDGQFNCTGNLTITRTNGDDIQFISDDNNSLIHIGGNLSITSTGGEELIFDIDNDGTIDVDGNVTILHNEGLDGEIDLEYNAGLTNPLFNIDGDFSLNQTGGNDDWLFDLNGGTFQIDGNMNLTNSGSGGAEDIEIQIDENAILNIGNSLNMTLSGGDDLSIEIGRNSTNSNGQLNIAQNLSLDHNGNTGGDDMFINLGDNSRGTVGNNLLLNSDFTNDDLLYVRLNTTSELTVTNNIEMHAATSGKTNLELNNSSILHIAGNFIRQVSPNNFGTLTATGNATVDYMGSSPQIFAQDAGSGTDGFTYQNVMINNTSSTVPQITMEGEASINGNITFLDGIVASTASNVLTINNNADALSESDNSFVDGPVQKIGNDAFDFPIGDNGQLQPLSISAPTNTTDAFTAQYIENDPDPTFDKDSKDASINHVSQCEYWTLDRTVGTSDVQVALTHDPNSCGVTNLSTLIVARWNGTTWQNHDGTSTGDLTTGVTQTPSAVASFIPNMPFTLASLDLNNPLPIELLSFSAEENNGKATINWSTASEINNDFFAIERSKDGKKWEDIAQIKSKGNSNSIQKYSQTDYNPFTGTSYYRLRQQDLNGELFYSKIATVNFKFNDVQFSLFPNPSRENESVNLLLEGVQDESLTINIYDVAGKEIYSMNTTIENSKLIPLNAKQQLTSGIYLVYINGDNISQTHKLVVK